MQQWQFFRIPVNNGAEATADLNHFLRGARILAVHREFVAQGESSYWALAVEFLRDGGEAARREKPANRNDNLGFRLVLPANSTMRADRRRPERQ